MRGGGSESPVSVSAMFRTHLKLTRVVLAIYLVISKLLSHARDTRQPERTFHTLPSVPSTVPLRPYTGPTHPCDNTRTSSMLCYERVEQVLPTWEQQQHQQTPAVTDKGR